jgi:aminoglycoside phosphotransferase (APT) family kinase protein
MSAEESRWLDHPEAPRDDNAFDTGRLVEWLRECLPEWPSGALQLSQFQGGASNLTFELQMGDKRLILRRPPPGTKPRSGHDMGREFRVLSGLYGHYPCPRPLAYCDETDVIGAPFYVMEKVEGIILRRDPPQGLDYGPERAGHLCRALWDQQIALHELDYAAAGLADLGRPEGYVARQVEGWNERYRRARTEDAPACEEIMHWLEREQPPDGARPGLIHNDYRFDNVVLDPTDQLSIIAVLDWEMCTLGDPLMDLGCSLAYWVEAGDPAPMQTIRMQPSGLPGMMTRADVVRYYTEQTGRAVDNPRFYYVFGLFRLAVIAQQIYFRFYNGQSRNPRHQAFGHFVGILADMAAQTINNNNDGI